MRVDGKGRIDRTRPLSFSWDGRELRGFAGDTLASALLANGVRLMGRSFKYHRPRGTLTSDSAEPNALVTLGRGAAQEPNQRATTLELFEGLAARSQNRWPSLAHDLLAVNDLVAPFIGAGFYYKTFMWPRGFWRRVYEPAIRRAAGLGALSGAAVEDRSEKAFSFCDVLVIGAGPAGLMAARAAGRAGAQVILCDEDSEPGGRLLAEIEDVGNEAGHRWAARVAGELRGMPNVRVMTRTTVTGAYDQGVFAALERVGRHLPSRADLPTDCFWRIVARRAVLCAGALERPVAFRDNDRPGVMLAGAVRAYLNRWGVAVGRRVAVFGCGDDAHRTARDLRAAGVHVAALIDARPDAACDLDVPFHAGGVVTRAQGGRDGLEAIAIRDAGGREDRIAVDALAVSGGWTPSIHLSCHLGALPVWREDLAAFLPPADGGLLGIAGAANGAVTTAACLADGADAGRRAVEALGLDAAPLDLPDAAADRETPVARPLWHVPGRGRAWLDFQNDVTVKDVTQAAREGFRSVEHMKRYTTQGMAPDQGKSSNLGALAVLAEATGRGIAETGTTTFRPPFVPVPIAAMGAGGKGAGFAPERRAPAEAASRRLGAEMVEAGLWYRPSWYARAGETQWRQACDREARMVRDSVGVADVSTLGKIAVDGPDAGAFLDFVYANTMSTLAPGRVRYGIMLREDGHVMDDGTCARLGSDSWLVTTTTGAAPEVLRHLEFVRQVLRPELDLALACVTDHWAQFAVAGPRARDLLNDVLDAPASAGMPPFMGVAAVTVGGVAARLFRISFSGELGYEIAVPARYGASLFEALESRARALGGGAYGLEAMNVLRIEKGFLTHAEIDGRTTAFDLGVGGMIAAAKDCIGKVMAARPGLTAQERPQLVGLRPAGAARRLVAGAHLFPAGTSDAPARSEGHVTSAAFSPAVDDMIALALLCDGHARHGETLRMSDRLRGVETLCTVGPPVFFDPEGGRARG